MSIGKADAKIENAFRRVEKGKRTSLYIVDTSTDPVTIIGKVKIWNWELLSPLAKNDPSHKILIAQDSHVATPANLKAYQVALNGIIHDVLLRTPPQGNAQVLWTLLTLPTNQKV